MACGPPQARVQTYATLICCSNNAKYLAHCSTRELPKYFLILLETSSLSHVIQKYVYLTSKYFRILFLLICNLILLSSENILFSFIKMISWPGMWFILLLFHVGLTKICILLLLEFTMNVN